MAGTMGSNEHFVEEIDLQRYWLVLKRRWLPASAVLLGSIAVSMFASLSSDELIYGAKGELLFETNRTSSLTGVGQDLGELEALTTEGNPLDTQSSLITSLPLLNDVVQKLDIRDEEGEPVSGRALREALEVSPDENTDIISVRYQSEDPELSAAIVNQLMRSYITFNVQNNRSEVRAARKFLEKELPRAEAEVKRLSDALQAFNEQNQIVNLGAEATAAVNSIASLDDQITASQAQLAQLESRNAELRRQLGVPLERALALGDLSEADGVQQVFSEWQMLQTELAKARSQYTDEHPNVRVLARQEGSLREILETRMLEVTNEAVSVSNGNLQFSPLKKRLAEQLVDSEIERISLNNSLSVLANTRDAYIDWADIFPSLENTQIDLTNKLNYARNTYENLLQRLQEVRLAENQNVGSARIIEEASVPTEPLSAGQSNYLILGTAAGLLLGVAVAFFLDLIDRSIKTIRDGEKTFGLILLGVIPRFEATKESDWRDMPYGTEGLPSPRIVTTTSTYPMISGAYQMLQANLRFISSDKKLKSLVITSSTYGEGKSEVCANLAASIAQTDRRVLLIDADMRSPDQHHLWNMVNATGLSHVLVGEGKLENALQPISENLTLLTAGVVPPNPLALIDSERMAGLLARFSEQYDYVIVDTPPLSGNADAAVLGNLADGILMIMRPRLVTYDSAISSKGLLKRSGANVLGLIANGVDIKVESSEYTHNAQASEYIASATEKSAVPLLSSSTDNRPWK
ncbi:MAG: polysaccharide biosynthesis tyrosine autokinase [Cyanobacteria bacterium P01_G01_bin.38]